MRLTSLLLMVGLALTACSKNTGIDSLPAGSTFGGKITLTETMTLTEAGTNLADLIDKEIRIDGFIQGMCTNKGDWLVWSEGDNQLIVQFKDRAFTIPTNSMGKNIIVQGFLREEPLPPDCGNAQKEQHAAHSASTSEDSDSGQHDHEGEQHAAADQSDEADTAAEVAEEQPKVNRMFFLATAVRILE